MFQDAPAPAADAGVAAAAPAEPSVPAAPVVAPAIPRLVSGGVTDRFEYNLIVCKTTKITGGGKEKKGTRARRSDWRETQDLQTMALSKTDFNIYKT